MHFRTSLMLGSDAGNPDFLLPHIFNRSTRPAVNSGSYRHPAVRQAGAGTSDGETAYAVEEDRVPGLLELHVEHVSTGTRRVCANRERWEGQAGRLSGGWDERPVDANLCEVVVGVEGCGLVHEQLVLAVGVPFHCVVRGLSGRYCRRANGGLTMVRNSIDPLVEC